MFDIVKTNVFTRSAFSTRSLQEQLSNDSELDFGGVLGTGSAHILLFGRPGDKGMHVFWESANDLDLCCEK